MKYHVVYDAQGNIIAVSYSDLPAPQVHDQLAPRFAPEARSGQHVAEIEVSPEEHAKFGLTDIAERLRVDVKAPRPMLISKSQ
jgi:hypothetical protein